LPSHKALRWLDHHVFEFWDALRPAKRIRDQADAFLRQHNYPARWTQAANTNKAASDAQFLLGVHSRIFIYEGKSAVEVSTEAGRKAALDECRKIVSEDKVVMSLIERSNSREQRMKLLLSSCWMVPNIIDETLNFHGWDNSGVEKISITPGKSGARQHWFLATDRSSRGVLDKILHEHGAITSGCFKLQRGVTEYCAPGQTHEFIPVGGPMGNPVSAAFKAGEDHQYLERAVFDIEMLRRARFFIGNAASTFSYTVCLIRGRKVSEDSNICCDFFSAYGLDSKACASTAPRATGALFDPRSMLKLLMNVKTEVKTGGGKAWRTDLSGEFDARVAETKKAHGGEPSDRILSMDLQDKWTKESTGLFTLHKQGYCSNSMAYVMTSASFEECKFACMADKIKCRCFDYWEGGEVEGIQAQCRLFPASDAAEKGEVSHSGYNAWVRSGVAPAAAAAPAPAAAASAAAAPAAGPGASLMPNDRIVMAAFNYQPQGYCSETLSFDASGVSFGECATKCLELPLCSCFDYWKEGKSPGNGWDAKCRLSKQDDAVRKNEVSHMGYNAWVKKRNKNAAPPAVAAMSALSAGSASSINLAWDQANLKLPPA
jgi:hypothetical protein